MQQYTAMNANTCEITSDQRSESPPSDVYACSRSETMPTDHGPSPMPIRFRTNNMIDAATARIRSPTSPCVNENTGASQYEPSMFGTIITQNASHGLLVR